MNIDFEKPITDIKFPEKHISVINPSDEPFVKLNNHLKCNSQYCKQLLNGKPIPYASPDIYVRKSVFEKLMQVQHRLPEHYKLCIYDGYRDIAVQNALWAYYRVQIEARHKSLPEDEIDRLTAFCVTKPSYDIHNPSLHNTGGAIDLTLLYDNYEVNMGTNFDDFTQKAWTSYYETHKDRNITRNRRILYNTMTAQGFTNLPSEWWHYDYGDEKWAILTNSEPFYAGVLHTADLQVN